MQEHGPLGDARRAARILQEGDVVRRDRHRLRRRLAPCRKHGLEGDGARQVVRLDGFLHVARDGVHDHAFEAHEVAGRNDHDRVEGEIGQRFLCGVPEILEHEEDAGAGIAQLMNQLARGVERVDVDDRQARGEDAEQDRRVGHHVRQHDGDAVALAEAFCLQPGSDGVRGLAELGIGLPLAEALGRRPRRVAGDAVAEEIGQGAEPHLVDRGRHARRIRCQPGLSDVACRVGRHGRCGARHASPPRSPQDHDAF